ncbi:unnamed protein product [Brachionus calyciflorus]|uniref:Transmembrane protein 234 n=1 Tax=Brachionus calyciflorus TaxID=104777 RepID=A0A813NEF2_9BILA|nr:unnamed protein product [Brachionus calyciflorus]
MQLFLILTSALLWGITNPFIRKGSSGLENINSDNYFKRILLELKFLFSNLNYLIPFILNQLGSILFYITLAYANLSLVVPLTNSLTLLFTTFTAIALGEQEVNSKTLLGLGFVIAGVCLCVSAAE